MQDLIQLSLNLSFTQTKIFHHKSTPNVARQGNKTEPSNPTMLPARANEAAPPNPNVARQGNEAELPNPNVARQGNEAEPPNSGVQGWTPRL